MLFYLVLSAIHVHAMPSDKEKAFHEIMTDFQAHYHYNLVNVSFYSDPTISPTEKEEYLAEGVWGNRRRALSSRGCFSKYPSLLTHTL